MDSRWLAAGVVGLAMLSSKVGSGLRRAPMERLPPPDFERNLVLYNLGALYHRHLDGNRIATSQDGWDDEIHSYLISQVERGDLRDAFEFWKYTYPNGVKGFAWICVHPLRTIWGEGPTSDRSVFTIIKNDGYAKEYVHVHSDGPAKTRAADILFTMGVTSEDISKTTIREISESSPISDMMLHQSFDLLANRIFAHIYVGERPSGSGLRRAPMRDARDIHQILKDIADLRSLLRSLTDGATESRAARKRRAIDEFMALLANGRFDGEFEFYLGKNGLIMSHAVPHEIGSKKPVYAYATAGENGATMALIENKEDMWDIDQNGRISQAHALMTYKKMVRNAAEVLADFFWYKFT